MADFNNTPGRNQKPDFKPAGNGVNRQAPANRQPLQKNTTRKQKVQNFVLNIDENHQERKMDTTSNRPATKGEVYFTNYQRRAGEPSAPRYTGTAQNRRASEGNAKNVPINRAGQGNAGRNVSAFENGGNKASADAKNKRKKKYLSDDESKKFRKFYSRTMLIAMSCVLVLTVLFSVIGIDCINDALALSVSDEEIEVTIPDNITTSQAIQLFKDKGLIKVPWFCKFFADFRGYDEEGIYYYVNGEKKLQPYMGGTYYLSRSMGLEGMLNILLDNSATSEQTVNITFPEGYTIAQIIKRLEDYEILTNSKKFIGAASYEYQYEFLDNPNKGMAFNLEGYMFPDTYDMYIGESSSSIIKRFLENFDTKWTEEYKKRADELGYTTSEILTIASIIQKEAAGQSQMADISSVIHNRLNNSASYPMLQCDSTALYVTNYLTELLGEKKAKQYLDRYDTAVCIGLPEGPICNPGDDAIYAALYPSDTSYLYFCHDKSGNVYYATTDLEHQQNVSTIL